MSHEPPPRPAGAGGPSIGSVCAYSASSYRRIVSTNSHDVINPSATAAQCLRKRIHDIIDCNLKPDGQILIISARNISDTTGRRTTV